MNNNLQESIMQYWAVNPSLKSAITTSLFKYCFPKLGFKLSKRSQKRIHPEDKQLALEFAQKIKLTSDLANKLIECQEKIFAKSKINSTSKRQHRKNLKHFIEFLSENHLKDFDVDQSFKRPSKHINAFRNKVLDSVDYAVNTPKRRKKQKIALSLDPTDYAGDVKNVEQNLSNIKLELKNFENFLKTYSADKSKRSKYTNEMRLGNLLRLLGWMHQRKNIELQELNFRQLVDVFNINPDPNDFETINDFYIAESKIKHQAKKATTKTIKLLEYFFSDYDVRTKGTKQNYIISVLDVAKFLYRDITDVNWAENYEDIPVVVRLRIYLNKLPLDNKVLEPELISWETVLKCLEEYKRRADLETFTYKKNRITKKGEVFESYPRRRSAIAKGIQKFIVFGIFTLIPPPRCRVVRELKIGETFKHGLFVNNLFVPKDKLEDPKSAKYYIHLQPEDYKTGKTYGEWLAEFPNIKFKDDKNFYEYLDKWIYGGARNLLLTEAGIKEDHKFLLIQENKGAPLTTSSLTSMVISFFVSTIGQRISAHKLRTIFRTYLVNKNASKAELESAAFWMRHSSETAKKIYTKQTLDEKLNPGITFATKLNSGFLQSLDTSEND